MSTVTTAQFLSDLDIREFHPHYELLEGALGDTVPYVLSAQVKYAVYVMTTCKHLAELPPTVTDAIRMYCVNRVLEPVAEIIVAATVRVLQDPVWTSPMLVEHMLDLLEITDPFIRGAVHTTLDINPAFPHIATVPAYVLHLADSPDLDHFYQRAYLDFDVDVEIDPRLPELHRLLKGSKPYKTPK